MSTLIRGVTFDAHVNTLRVCFVPQFLSQIQSRLQNGTLQKDQSMLVHD